ncbi:MAG: hypothetical protein M0Z30_19600, partial [Actinomycetota bacterium]|nr:hypothetical protein [Actinomycetota bacterium]
MSGARRRDPYLPFCDLNSLEVLEVGGGRARCATTIGSWLEGAGLYSIPAGVAALADMVLMYAASTHATPGMMPVTAGLRLDLWSAPPEVGTRLLGEARVQGAPGDMLLVTGRIAAGEQTLATATIRSMLVPAMGGASSERPPAPVPG